MKELASLKKKQSKEGVDAESVLKKIVALATGKKGPGSVSIRSFSRANASGYCGNE